MTSSYALVACLFVSLASMTSSINVITGVRHIHYVNTTAGVANVTLTIPEEPILFVRGVHGSRASIVMAQKKGEVQVLDLMMKKHRHNAHYQWLAVKPNVNNSDTFQHGIHKVDFNTRKTCASVSFTTAMTGAPVITLSMGVPGGTLPDKLQYAVVWIANSTSTEFSFCVHEGFLFSGVHHAVVMWLAQSATNETVQEIKHISLSAGAKKIDGADCECLPFTNRYVEPPLVFVTAETSLNSEAVVWVDHVTTRDVMVCAKQADQSAKVEKVHLVVAAPTAKKDSFIHNCSGVAVHNNMECYASETDPSGHVTECIRDCVRFEKDTCMDQGEEQCASDHGTYANKCEMRKQTCDMYGMTNAKEVRSIHSGACVDHAIQVGSLQLEPFSGHHMVFCARASMQESWFTNLTRVSVVVSLRWSRASAEEVHSAALPWTENVTRSGFRVCARGMYSAQFRDEKPIADWVAFQKNVHARTHGVMSSWQLTLGNFHGGSHCFPVTMPVTVGNNTKILLSSHHTANDDYYNVISQWLESTDSNSKYRVCATETRAYTGVHTNLEAVGLIINPSRPHSSLPEAPSTVEEGFMTCRNVSFLQPSTNRTLFTSLTNHRIPAEEFSSQFSQYLRASWTEVLQAGSVKVCEEYIPTSQIVGQASDQAILSFAPVNDVPDSCASQNASTCAPGMHCVNSFSGFSFGTHACTCQTPMIMISGKCVQDACALPNMCNIDATCTMLSSEKAEVACQCKPGLTGSGMFCEKV